MGSRKHRGMLASEGPAIKSFGTFSIIDQGGQSRFTLSANLEPEPFPIQPGQELKVEQVDPDGEPAFLRLIPVEE